MCAAVRAGLWRARRLCGGGVSLQEGRKGERERESRERKSPPSLSLSLSLSPLAPAADGLLMQIASAHAWACFPLNRATRFEKCVAIGLAVRP